MADAEDVKEVVQEEKVLDNRREFTLELPEGEIFHYYIADPSGEDIRKADWQYSKIYNQAIMDDFLTQAQMVDRLKKKGIINEERDQRLEDIRIRLGAELFKLENVLGKDAPDEDREVCALEVSRLRDELFELNQQVNGPMAATCENLAEDARTDFLTSRVVQNKDGSRVWEDFEDFLDEENTALVIKSRFEVMLWMQGLESNFIENTPEQATLRELAQRRFEEAMNRATEEIEGETADAIMEETVAASEDLELPEPEEKPKPRKPRTRKTPTTKKKVGRPKGSKNKPKPSQDE